MPFFTWIAGKLTGEALKAGGEAAKTATEIPKNLIETKKAALEVAVLEREARERERLITPATFDDVKEFGGTYQRIRNRVGYQAARLQYSSNKFAIFPVGVVLLIALLSGTYGLFYHHVYVPPILEWLERALWIILGFWLLLMAIALIWAGILWVNDKIRG